MLFWLTTAAWAQAPIWTPTGATKPDGISGLLALPAEADGSPAFLAVHDVKGTGTALRRIVGPGPDGQVSVTPLRWEGDAPLDLEAIAAVPGEPDAALVLQSDGVLRRVRVAGDAVTVEAVWQLPDVRNAESLVVVGADGPRLHVAWAERGGAGSPAEIETGWLPPRGGRARAVMGVGLVLSPLGRTLDVRHLSDLALVDGTLWAAAASDPGDAGPFRSAVWIVGSVQPGEGGATWTVLAGAPSPDLPACVEGHKVEALLVSGDGGWLGTDDEDLGAALAPWTTEVLVPCGAPPGGAPPGSR
jgi:hypothetical protein